MHTSAPSTLEPGHELRPVIRCLGRPLDGLCFTQCLGGLFARFFLGENIVLFRFVVLFDEARAVRTTVFDNLTSQVGFLSLARALLVPILHKGDYLTVTLVALVVIATAASAA